MYSNNSLILYASIIHSLSITTEVLIYSFLTIQLSHWLPKPLNSTLIVSPHFKRHFPLPTSLTLNKRNALKAVCKRWHKLPESSFQWVGKSDLQKTRRLMPVFDLTLPIVYNMQKVPVIIRILRIWSVLYNGVWQITPYEIY